MSYFEIIKRLLELLKTEVIEGEIVEVFFENLSNQTKVMQREISLSYSYINLYFRSLHEKLTNEEAILLQFLEKRLTIECDSLSKTMEKVRNKTEKNMARDMQTIELRDMLENPDVPEEEKDRIEEALCVSYLQGLTQNLQNAALETEVLSLPLENIIDIIL
ncbi:MAG: hypothetical protein K2M17_05550, partial [Bacilli bacterium]|nr:hypothetical protein [Bacilli bacterium]